MQNCYMYEGPVTQFGKILQERWVATTHASTVAKATSNFRYRWNKTHNRIATSKIELPGNITQLEGF